MIVRCMYHNGLIKILSCINWPRIYFPFHQLMLLERVLTQRNEIGQQNSYHVITLLRSDLQLRQCFLEIVKQIISLLITQLPIFNFTLGVLLFEFLIGQPLIPFYPMKFFILYLLNDELTRKGLNLMQHSKFLHQSIAVGLSSSHLELFQHRESDERIQTHTCNQNKQYDHSVKPFRKILPKPYCWKSDYNNLKAIYEAIFPHQKQSMAVKHHNRHIHQQNLGNSHFVQKYLHCEEEIVFWLNPVNIYESARARLEIHARSDVILERKDNSDQHNQLEIVIEIVSPNCGIYSCNQHLSNGLQNCKVINYVSRFVCFDQNAMTDCDEQNKQNSENVVKYDGQVPVIMAPIDQVNRKDQCKHTEICDDFIDQQQLGHGVAHLERIQHRYFTQLLFARCSFLIILGLDLVELKHIFIQWDFTLELTRNRKGVLIDLIDYCTILLCHRMFKFQYNSRTINQLNIY